MDIIPSTEPKSLTSDTTFSNYILIVDAYYNILKLYGNAPAFVSCAPKYIIQNHLWNKQV